MRSIFAVGLLCFALMGEAQNNPHWIKAGKYAGAIENQRQTEYVYTEVSEFSEGFAWVNKGQWYGYVNADFDSVTPFKYSVAHSFQNGFAAVAMDSFYGFVDTSGKEICPLQYVRVLPFSLGYGRVFDGKSWNLMDENGQTVLDSNTIFPPVLLTSNRIAVFWHDKWGVIHSDGHVCHPFIYTFIRPDGVAYVGNEKLYLGL